MNKLSLSVFSAATLISGQCMAYTGDVNFNSEISYMDISSVGDSAAPISVFFRLGYEINRNLVLQGYVGTGFTDDVLESEDIGIDTYRTYAELNNALGIQAKIKKQFSWNNEMYFLVGYGKTEIDLVDEDCFGGFTVTCVEDSYSISDEGVSYGLGLDFGGFTMSYNIFYDDTVKDIDIDAKVTGINLGYKARF